MPHFDLSEDIVRTAQEIYNIKEQINTASPRDKGRLQRRLKELQILQLWQLEKQASDEVNPDR